MAYNDVLAAQKRLIWRDDDDRTAYERAVYDRVFNLRRLNCLPNAVIRATCEQDVIYAFRLAIQHNCQVAVRSGGHSIPTWSLHDNSILVDLGDWKELKVDATTNICTVIPSTTSQELMQRLQAQHKLMFPAGHHPDVGLGGFLLQGGQSWNCRNWGWACERVIAVEVVTADGELLLCNDQENSDLFWAARGAGPLFPAVVTRFHLQCTPCSAAGFFSSQYIYTADAYHQVIGWMLSILSTADKDTEIVLVAFHPPQCDTLYLKVHFVTMKSDALVAIAVLRELHHDRPTGTISESVCDHASFDGLFHEQKMANPPSHYYHVDNVFIANDVDLAGTLKQGFLTLPPGKSFAFWYPMYPRSRQSCRNITFSVPSDHYFAVYAISDNQMESERYKHWMNATMTKLREDAVGSYIGDSDLTLSEEWYWSRETVEKIHRIRQKWDPRSMLCTVHDPFKA